MSTEYNKHIALFKRSERTSMYNALGESEIVTYVYRCQIKYQRYFDFFILLYLDP